MWLWLQDCWLGVARQCGLLALAMCLAFAHLAFPAAVQAGELPSMPASKAAPTPGSLRNAAALGVGCWIWTTNFVDKQRCRLWREFTVPASNRLTQATLRITADNIYRLYLDGNELGMGGDWRSLSEYDLIWLLKPGKHVLAIEALNDNKEAGVIAGLHLRFLNGPDAWVLSDQSWRVVPNSARRWLSRTEPDSSWPPAQEVGVVGQHPWWSQPISIIPTPALLPVELRFWQQTWFLVTILSVCLVAVALSLRLAAQLAIQSRAQRLLEQERARIARDIHDDLGAGLTQLTLQSELAQSGLPAQSPIRQQLAELCVRSRKLSDVLDEVVWAVNPKRDSVQEFTSYLCVYAERFLAKRDIRCRFEVDPEMANAQLDLPTRRNLLLAVKEALRNVVRHSQATEVFLRLQNLGDHFTTVVEDNGRGFDPATAGNRRNGLTNMTERLQLVGGHCEVNSQPGTGCCVHFTVPLPEASRLSWPRRLWSRLRGRPAGAQP